MIKLIMIVREDYYFFFYIDFIYLVIFFINYDNKFKYFFFINRSLICEFL